MDGDGKLDIVAARATVPMTSGAKPEGELLWLKQPAINATNGSPWVETVVVAGPDVDFIMEASAHFQLYVIIVSDHVLFVRT